MENISLFDGFLAILCVLSLGRLYFMPNKPKRVIKTDLGIIVFVIIYFLIKMMI